MLHSYNVKSASIVNASCRPRSVVMRRGGGLCVGCHRAHTFHGKLFFHLMKVSQAFKRSVNLLSSNVGIRSERHDLHLRSCLPSLGRTRQGLLRLTSCVALFNGEELSSPAIGEGDVLL